MNSPFTAEWIKKYSDLEKTSGQGETRPWVYGKYHYRERIADICEWALSNYEGDVLEIGVYGGATSEVLAPICVKHKRKLVLVDPWEDDGAGLDTVNLPIQVARIMSPYGDAVQIIKKRSQDPEAIRLIREHQFAFAFIDGDHLDGYSSDLHTVLPLTNGIVATDDWFYNDIAADTRKIAPQYGWQIAMEIHEFGEVYLLRA